MRTPLRLFLAATLFTVAAGFASAQESNEPPPAPAPDAAVPPAEVPPVPVVELQPIPVVDAAPVPDPSAPPAVDPALSIDPSALAVAPAAVAIVEQPAPEKPAVTTTTTRVTKKTAKKPVAKPVVEATESLEPNPAAAVVAGTRVETLPPPDAAASTAPARSIAPAPAAEKSVVLEPLAEGAESETSIGIGGWLLAGLVVAAMVFVITMVRRRRMQTKTSMVDFPGLPELKPAPVSRL
jgi:hypothetical protein